jgi:hypothetical protein
MSNKNKEIKQTVNEAQLINIIKAHWARRPRECSTIIT